ncbi:MAG: hypothetical protein ABSF56_00790 [Minisyncoccia bacterium]
MDKNSSSNNNNVRWFIKAISTNLKTAIEQRDDKMITARYKVSCVDRNGREIGPYSLYEIPADFKDDIVKNRVDFGFEFVLFRAVGEGRPVVYYEWPRGRPAYPAPKHRRLKKGSVFPGSALLGDRVLFAERAARVDSHP